jgi:hypothetical protein
MALEEEQMTALIRRLESSLELALECAQLIPLLSDRAGEMGRLCLDHLAHAEALTRLILEVQPSSTDRAGTLPADASASLRRFSAGVSEARAAAWRECLAASGAREIELFGTIAAALATHEELLREPDETAVP